ncbi:hypothetical protein PROFUN_15183 [Planoprotostelium fungivorum]|uniref:Uncharacterized protein n=1 Tax=Planoprotostelium fungivorum TaxID=1890364 RepID=A0A2P6MVY6_9EUKA|nr:hypothetical protein PROFUN_15183 [Planoprotostelium fungivorum]
MRAIYRYMPGLIPKFFIPKAKDPLAATRGEDVSPTGTILSPNNEDGEATEERSPLMLDQC